MLHLTLDTTDPSLDLQHLGINKLPLLFCNRCSLAWHDLTYVVASNGDIDLVEFFTGETMWEEWYEDVGVDVFPRRPFTLTSIPDRLQELYDRLNDDEELTRSEEEKIAALTGQVCEYPIADVINQVGGRSFLCQRLDDPVCVHCFKQGERREMFFLASLTNDAARQFKITFPSLQIVFFFCPHCRAVKVVQSAD